MKQGKRLKVTLSIFFILFGIFLTQTVEASTLDNDELSLNIVMIENVTSIEQSEENALVIEETVFREETASSDEETELTATEIGGLEPSAAEEATSEATRMIEEIAETVESGAVLEEETSAIENVETIPGETQIVEDIPEATQTVETEDVFFMVLSEAPSYAIQENNGNLYIVNIVNGEVRKDNAWVELNDKWYFPNVEGVLYRNQAITFGPGNLYYLNDRGEKVTNTIQPYAGSLYLLGEDGKSRNDNAWVDLDSGHYFPNAQGKLYFDQWISFGSKVRHYMGSNGASYTGVQRVANNLHLFDDQNLKRGVLRKDNAWVELNDKWYYPNAEGVLYRNQAITFGPGNLYYLNDRGEKVTNTIQPYAGSLYLLGEDGKSRNDNAWVDLDSGHYFPNAQGKLYFDQWISFGSKVRHYMGSSGAAYTGVQRLANNLHLFDDQDLKRGVLRIDNAWVPYGDYEYFPNAEGNLYHDQAITFGAGNLYYMDSEGRKVRNQVVEVGKDLYLLRDDGKSRTDNAWVEHKNQWYFPNAQGKLYRNQRITFGSQKAHYMGNDGYAVSGVHGQNGILYYYEDYITNKNPERKSVGWIDLNGKRYFAREGGQLYVNQTITFGPNMAFYMQKDGSLRKELVIDISQWQPSYDLDYDKIAAQVKAVIIRIGTTDRETGYGYYADEMFEIHYREFKKRGVPVGGYWYSASNTYEGGVAEANHAISLMKEKQFELPIYWDVENKKFHFESTKENVTAAGLGFLTTLENHNYFSGIYASASFYPYRLNLTQLKPRAVWVAHWNTDKPDYSGEYGMWQFSSKGRLDGFNGDIDLNYMYYDYPSIIINSRMNGF